MDEWFKSPPWKGGTGLSLSRVRISLSPPTSLAILQYQPKIYKSIHKLRGDFTRLFAEVFVRFHPKFQLGINV